MSGGPIVCPGRHRITPKSINIRINSRVEVSAHQQRDVRVNGLIKGLKKLLPFILLIRRIKAHDLKKQVVAGKFRNYQPSIVIPLSTLNLEFGFEENGNARGTCATR
jgi:hypothetical protein